MHISSIQRLLLLLCVLVISLNFAEGVPIGSAKNAAPTTPNGKQKAPAAPGKPATIPPVPNKPEHLPVPVSKKAVPAVGKPPVAYTKFQNGQAAGAKKAPASPNGKPTSSGQIFKSYAHAVKNGKPEVGKHGQPATAKDAKSKKPRCKHPSSKRGIHKRAPGEDCEEWTENAVMTDSSGAPKTAGDNKHHSFFAKKWKYTDANYDEAHAMDPNQLGRMSQTLAENQRDYYNGLEKTGNQPWKPDKHPGAAGLNVQLNAYGDGVHDVRGATSMFKPKPPPKPPGTEQVGSKRKKTRKGKKGPASKKPKIAPTLHPEVEKLRAESKANRSPAHAGAHVEEINASERAAEGKTPLRNTLNSVHDTEEILDEQKENESEPMRACKGNCGKFVKAGGGTDANAGADPTSKQKARAERKAAAKKSKKKVQNWNLLSRPKSDRQSQASSQTSSQADPEEVDRLIGEQTTSPSGKSGSSYEDTD